MEKKTFASKRHQHAYPEPVDYCLIAHRLFLQSEAMNCTEYTGHDDQQCGYT